jgi:hypothetical protein
LLFDRGAFSHERVLAALVKEIEALEHTNGLESPQPASRFAFFGKKIKRMEERVAQLEELLG